MPALTAEAWISGESAPPTLMPARPGSVAAAPAAKKVARKTVGQLETEVGIKEIMHVLISHFAIALQVAAKDARIAELEAKVPFLRLVTKFESDSCADCQVGRKVREDVNLCLLFSYYYSINILWIDILFFNRTHARRLTNLEATLSRCSPPFLLGPPLLARPLQERFPARPRRAYIM